MALAQNPYAQYKQLAINTAGPEKLLIMLFDGAIRFCVQARQAIEKNDFESSNKYLLRCQDIVNELIASLNMDYEISHSLFKMYDYINYNLMQANIRKDLQHLAEAEKYLREFREVWTQAIKLVQKPPLNQSTGDEKGEQK
ncbi:MAG: flagellar export chaperone FliS [Clostridia bacterium]|nr:flagellar export chaperone FliS [Clostridia bacterium]